MEINLTDNTAAIYNRLVEGKNLAPTVQTENKTKLLNNNDEVDTFVKSTSDEITPAIDDSASIEDNED